MKVVSEFILQVHDLHAAGLVEFVRFGRVEDHMAMQLYGVDAIRRPEPGSLREQASRWQIH
jgi:hypothetical protein